MQASPPPPRSLWRSVGDQWFLIGLGAALVLGAMAQESIRPIADLPGMRSGLVAGVLFLMGITLQSHAITHSLLRPRAALLALAMNVLGVPALAAMLAPLLPPDLAGGLIVAAAVPCTLASASVWTRRGRGNDAVSMLVTAVTNLLCFVIAPTTLLLLIGRSTEIDAKGQALSLFLLVVVPLLIAQTLRRRRSVAAWADRRKAAFSNVAQVGILVMVSLGIAETTYRMQGDAWQILPLVLLVVLAMTVHTAALVGGWWIAGRLGLPHGERVAVAIAGSQKTLMVGLQIAIDCGVSMLPMIVYHVGQLLIDTLFVISPRIRRGR